MEWIDRRERQALKRIVAVLLSLAALAELAGSKNGPLRAAVLWFLVPAERIARDFAIGLWEDFFSDRPNLSVARSPHDSDYAMRLAKSFVALAGLLRRLMRCNRALLPLRRVGHRPIRNLLLRLQNLAHATARTLYAPASPDTS